MRVDAFKIFFLFYFLSLPLFAESDGSGKRVIRLTLGKDAGAEIVLDARQAPLSQVLDEISQKTGVPVHYSVLPAGDVTALCVGSTVKKIVQCLMGPKVDMAFRFRDRGESEQFRDNPAEIWLLGSTLAEGGTAAVCSARIAGGEESDQQERPGQDMDQSQLDDLLAMSKSKDVQQRADAVAKLALAGHADDAHIHSTLKEAMNDEDASVRAQAVFVLAQREGEAATADLQQAMQDQDDSVRLAALESVRGDVGLLTQALHDSDETVRALAALKLEEMATENKSFR